MAKGMRFGKLKQPMVALCQPIYGPTVGLCGLDRPGYYCVQLRGVWCGAGTGGACAFAMILARRNRFAKIAFEIVDLAARWLAVLCLFFCDFLCSCFHLFRKLGAVCRSGNKPEESGKQES